MMIINRLFYLLLILFFTPKSFSQSYKEKDKQAHFLAGMTIGGIAYEASKNTNNTFLWTIGSVTAVGIGKELLDSRQPTNKFDVIDLSYTVGGGLISYVLTEYVGINGGVIGLTGLTGVYFRMNF